MFQKIISFFSFKKKAKIIIVGLDNSGKTTIIKHLQDESELIYEVTPTIGYNIETVQRKNFEFTIFDMSGQSLYRDLWLEYAREANAIIFVIDSSDKIRLKLVKKELDILLNLKEIEKAPIIFFSNKMDLESSLPPKEIVHTLDLLRLSRSWNIVPSNALKGDGIEQGMSWLAGKLNNTNN